MVVDQVKVCNFDDDHTGARVWMLPREWHEFSET